MDAPEDGGGKENIPSKEICAQARRTMQVTSPGKKINKGGAEMEKQEEKFYTRCTFSNRHWGIIRVKNPIDI